LEDESTYVVMGREMVISILKIDKEGVKE